MARARTQNQTEMMCPDCRLHQKRHKTEKKNIYIYMGKMEGKGKKSDLNAPQKEKEKKNITYRYDTAPCWQYRAARAQETESRKWATDEERVTKGERDRVLGQFQHK